MHTSGDKNLYKQVYDSLRHDILYLHKLKFVSKLLHMHSSTHFVKSKVISCISEYHQIPFYMSNIQKTIQYFANL